MAMSQQYSVLVLVATLTVLLCTGSAALEPSTPQSPQVPIKECLGFRDCDRNLTNGCETDILSDPKNCGDCGKVCKGISGRVSVCKNGECVFPCKAAGYASCYTREGCETFILGDVKNCGACGVVCEEKPGYITRCVNGTCVYDDKCTVTPCRSYPNAVTTCKAGNCTTNCSPGYADCNLNRTKDGCEVNVYADNSNCGACGVVCEEKPGYITSCVNGTCVYVDKCTVTLCQSYPNAATTCKAGNCTTNCTRGYADCNQDLEKDGCEVNVYTNNNSCGACGVVCRERQGYFAMCEGGRCVYIVNKCTENLDCPRYRNVESTCRAGICFYTCFRGFADCNKNMALDGCETNLSTDQFNCGGCGKICVKNGVCRDGFCVSPA